MPNARIVPIDVARAQAHSEQNETLWKASLGGLRMRDAVRLAERNAKVLLLAYFDERDELCGLAAYETRKSGRVLWLHELGVLFPRVGVGSALVQGLAAIAEPLGMSMQLEATGNSAAFYRTLGFSVSRETLRATMPHSLG